MEPTVSKAFKDAIEMILSHFDGDSSRRMRKAIKSATESARKHQDLNTDSGAKHIIREFIAGYALNRQGCSFQYDVPISNKTPDWLDLEIKVLMDGYTFERFGTRTFPDRVINAVSGKCSKYYKIADEHDLTIAVSVHLDFLSFVDLRDCEFQRHSFSHLFKDFSRLRGILFFAEESGGLDIAGQSYGFRYLTRDTPYSDDHLWGFPRISLS